MDKLMDTSVSSQILVSQEISKFVASAGLCSKCRVEDYKLEIIDWYELMDILIAPSEDEGFGRNLVEAIERRTYVIASNSGGHPEIITSNKFGKLVCVGDKKQYVIEIRKFMQIPDKREILSGPVRMELTEKYNPLKIAGSVSSQYNQLVNQQW